MRRIYIAGPMTGRPRFNFPAFDYATCLWRDAGWKVVSPADLTREIWRERFGTEFDPGNAEHVATTTPMYREFMAVDFAQLCGCDAIAMLPGSDRSRGATLELSVARALGLEVYDAETFQHLEPRHESVLQEAQRLVHGDRGAAYGHPIDDYTRTGRIWGAILGIPDIDPRLCCLMMAGVKVSREVNGHKRDNLTDLAGYAECAFMVAERQAAS